MNRTGAQQSQNLSYELGKSISQPHLQATINQAVYQSQNQPHYPLPQYTYGIQQQCTPCGPSYRLPVYYEEPMQVRE